MSRRRAVLAARQVKDQALRIHGVILAGGEGRRMGGADKALLMLGDQTLVARGVARLRPQVADLALSANGDAARFAVILPDVPVLADAASMGPLSGILAGLDWAAAQDATAILTLPVDAPFFPDDLVARLWAGAMGRPAYARAGRDHYATALWPVALAAPLRAFLASGRKPRIADFGAAQGAVAVDFPDPTAFDNLNHPEDLAAATLRLGQPS